jgi:hypothetical protein
MINFEMITTTCLFLVLFSMGVVRGITLSVSAKQLVEDHPLEVSEFILSTFSVGSCESVAALLKTNLANLQEHYDAIIEPIDRVFELLEKCKRPSVHRQIYSPAKLSSNPSMAYRIFMRKELILENTVATGGLSTERFEWELCKGLAQFIVEHQLKKVESLLWLEECIYDAPVPTFSEILKIADPLLSSNVIVSFWQDEDLLLRVLAVLSKDRSFRNRIRLSTVALEIPHLTQSSKVKGMLEDYFKNAPEIFRNWVSGQDMGQALSELWYNILLHQNHDEMLIELFLGAVRLYDVSQLPLSLFGKIAQVVVKARPSPAWMLSQYQEMPLEVQRKFGLRVPFVHGLREAPRIAPKEILDADVLLSEWRMEHGYIEKRKPGHSVVVEALPIPDSDIALREFVIINVTSRLWSDPTFLGFSTNCHVIVKYFNRTWTRPFHDICLDYAGAALLEGGLLFIGSAANRRVQSNRSSMDSWIAFIGCWPSLLFKGIKLPMESVFGGLEDDASPCDFAETFKLEIADKEIEEVGLGEFHFELKQACERAGLYDFHTVSNLRYHLDSSFTHPTQIYRKQKRMLV